MRLQLEKTDIWLGKGNISDKTESLLIAAQNNAIRTNYNILKRKSIKPNRIAIVVYMEKKDEMIDHIVSEGRKLE